MIPIHHHPECILVGTWGPYGAHVTKIYSGVLLSPLLVFVHDPNGKAC